MKKSIYLLGMAVAALSSCSQSDVVEMPESRAIGFSTFVNNNTRDAEEISKTNIQDFWVFGAHEETTDKWVSLYTNVNVHGSKAGIGDAESPTTWTPAQIAYWTADQKHNFAAYANGTTALTTGVEYAAKENKLTFSAYNAGTKDLVAATAANRTWDGESATIPVPFTFKHMLSKVYFTFKTAASKDYKMTVSELKINGTKEPAAGAIVVADGSLTGETIAWVTDEGVTNGEYTYTGIDDFADGTAGEDKLFSKASEARYVIPQANTSLTASFKVTFTDGSITKDKEFTNVPLTYTSAWTAGQVYNYIAIINPDDIDENAKPIEFTVTEVEDWTPANNQTVIEPEP